jgi:hypothetical protein
MDECYQPEWNNYLKQFDIGSKYFQHIPEKSDKYCVIIEPRKHPLLKLVIKNFMFLLKDWGIILYHGSDNEEFARSELSEIPNIHYVNLGVSNLTIDDYNNLLYSSNFWKQLMEFHCEYSLIFQTDTLLLNPDINRFLEYDYVGAPWDPEWIPGVHTGNGGLSLRKTKTMLCITSVCERDYPYNEDLYFAMWCKKLRFKIPSKETASHFSVETFFYESPCGLHKPHLNKFPSRESYTQMLRQDLVSSIISDK